MNEGAYADNARQMKVGRNPKCATKPNPEFRSRPFSRLEDHGVEDELRTGRAFEILHAVAGTKVEDPTFAGRFDPTRRVLHVPTHARKSPLRAMELDLPPDHQ